VDSWFDAAAIELAVSWNRVSAVSESWVPISATALRVEARFLAVRQALVISLAVLMI
jgi:hypothetical protein